MIALRQILERLKLTLDETKTKTVNAHVEKFDFLGFSIRMAESWKTGKLYPHVQPSKKALRAIKDRATVITHRKMTVKPLEKIMTEVNATVSGWVGYFHKFSSQKLYGKYGLYKVLTTADWKKVQAL